MKLLLCTCCMDVKAIHRGPPVRCRCGNSWGRYLPDGHNAEYGGTARILGMGNGSVERALYGEAHEKPVKPYTYRPALGEVLVWVKPLECARLVYHGREAEVPV